MMITYIKNYINNIISKIKHRNKNKEAYKEQLVIYIKPLLEHYAICYYYYYINVNFDLVEKYSSKLTFYKYIINNVLYTNVKHKDKLIKKVFYELKINEPEVVKNYIYDFLKKEKVDDYSIKRVSYSIATDFTPLINFLK